MGIFKHLHAFVYRHLQLGKGISIYVTLKLDADNLKKTIFKVCKWHMLFLREGRKN